MMTTSLVIDRINLKTHRKAAERSWCELTAKCEHSVFLSPQWQIHWLNSLPASTNVELWCFSHENTIVAGCFIGLNTGFDYGFVRAHRAYLNATGNNQFDDLCIEHNGILLAPGYHLRDCVGAINKCKDIDHLLLRNTQPFDTSELGDGHFLVDRRESKGYCVDLQKVADSESGLLSLISRNKRSQIRSSIKAYQRFGEIKMAVADSVEKCDHYFSLMTDYHTESWKNRGQSGVFGNPYFAQFHHEFLRNNYSTGLAEIVKISAGDTDLGIFYLFKYGKNVYYYQSGIKYQQQNVFKPGLVAHHLLSQKYAAEGFHYYDLMSGDDHYKKSIATESYPIQTTIVCRNKMRFRVLWWLRDCKHKLMKK